MKEPVSHIVSKIECWPLEKRRRYLIIAAKAEKSASRRSQILAALVPVTTDVLKEELAGSRRKGRTNDSAQGVLL